MPDVLRPLAEDALNRMCARSAPPEVVSMPEQGYWENLTCPYRDEDEALWIALLMDCFGTRAASVAQSFFRQLAALCPKVVYSGEDEARRDEDAIRQALAIVHGLKPRNEADAALAAQYVATYLVSMKLGSSMLRHDYIEPRSAAALAGLTKASAAQLSALRGRTKRTKQTFSVKRQVHVHHHHHDERHVHLASGAGLELENQSDGRKATRARARGAVPSPSTNNRETLPTLSDEGQEPLQISWRRKGDRCPEG